MKYDVLEPYKEYLQRNLTPNTAKTYYTAIKKLFQGYSFDNPQDISQNFLERELPKRFTTKNEFSAAKNGLKWMQKRYPNLQLPTEEFFRANSLRKRNFSKRPKKVIYLHPTQRRINQMQNPKFKYAYRLAMISGLRVSELADLEASDLTFHDGQIKVCIRHGKGGHGGTIQCRTDVYLYEKLKEYTKEHSCGKLFYNQETLRKEAARVGFECHDLRRIYAIKCKQELKQEMPGVQADKVVQQNLRHERFSTTKRYLYNRKLKVEYEQKDKTNTKL